jgi:hypothetical protein
LQHFLSIRNTADTPIRLLKIRSAKLCTSKIGLTQIFEFEVCETSPRVISPGA